jgi:hypothetical protein
VLVLIVSGRCDEVDDQACRRRGTRSEPGPPTKGRFEGNLNRLSDGVERDLEPS